MKPAFGMRRKRDTHAGLSGVVLSAPTGPRVVATGGATQLWASRNPWNRDTGTCDSVFSPRPRGAKEGPIIAGTYSQILLHIVFSTKGREPWIAEDLAARLYPYIGGIIRAEKGVLYDIGGVEDHVHLYLRWRPDESVSDLMRTVKGRSSLWVHQTFPELGAFTWQEGFSVFSVSKSQEEAVKKYIAGQREHHRVEDFKSELLRFLRAHEVDVDERYVFE